MSGDGSRRDFLRGLASRAARTAAAGVPDALAEAAGAAAPTAAEMERALTFPPGQRDIADAMAARGLLVALPDGRYAEPRDLAARIAGARLGDATRRWLERARAGAPLDPARPLDALALEATRAELRR
ncbi:MAG TPA: hypothetical protein VFS05_00790 [Gemmatimonadaceae bacterium]|nr:hypothetical protein [Gemmatimonadaceae bacterium]